MLLLGMLVVVSAFHADSVPRSRGATRAPVAAMISEELARGLVQKGFAIPGMEEAGRQVQDTARLCTQEAPCDFDAWQFASSLALSPGGVVLVALFFYNIGTASFDEDALASQAERSQRRREAALRQFAARLRPLQDGPLGWRLVDGRGMPTGDAFVFLAVAVASQVWLADLLLAAVQVPG